MKASQEETLGPALLFRNGAGVQLRVQLLRPGPRPLANFGADAPLLDLRLPGQLYT